MTYYDATVATLFCGYVCAFVFAILLPGYASLLLCHRLSLRFAARPNLSALTEIFPVAFGRDAFTASMLSGMLLGAIVTTLVSRSGLSLEHIGRPLFAAYALASLVVIGILRPRHVAKVAAPRREPPLEIVIFIFCIAGFAATLALMFYTAPNVWDVPTLQQMQQAYWGDYPPQPFRGGWIYPGLMLLFGVFAPAHFPLLNSAAGAGWLCVVILFTALVYLAPSRGRLVWLALVSAFLIDCRFTDFLLNTKFSVLGLALYLLCLGLLKSYVDTGQVRYAFFAAICLNIVFGAGLVGLFYALWTFAFLPPLLRLRLLPVAAAIVVWIAIASAGSAIHWTVGLAAIPLAFAASAAVVCWCQRLPFIPKTSSFDGKLAAAMVAAAAAITLIAFLTGGYRDYWWYAPTRLLSLYTQGCGVFLLPAIFFLACVASKKTVGPRAILLSAMCFTALVVPPAVMAVAPFIKLPATIPLFREIGRVTSLYFLPLTLCLTGAAIFTVMYRFLSERHPLLGYASFILVLALLVLPLRVYPDENLGGWQRMAFRPATVVFKAWFANAHRSATIAREIGPPRDYSPYIFEFSGNELQASRDLARFGGPSNRCLFVLMRTERPRQDAAAESFFAWRVMDHLFPYWRRAPNAAAIASDSACSGRATVLVPKSDVDLLTDLPAALSLRSDLGAYRIYSDAPRP